MPKFELMVPVCIDVARQTLTAMFEDAAAEFQNNEGFAVVPSPFYQPCMDDEEVMNWFESIICGNYRMGTHLNGNTDDPRVIVSPALRD